MTGLIVNKVESVQHTEGFKETAFMSNLRIKVKQGKSIAESFLSNLLSFSEHLKSSAKGKDSDTADIVKSDSRLIFVQPEIGEARLKRLADICQRSDKYLLINLPQASELPEDNKIISWNLKRIFDWLAAFVILICLSPVMLALAAIIAGTSSGSVFFHQWRVGENGKLFRIIKFRTMISDADKLHHLVMTGQTGLHKCEDDPRITPVGRWMRKYSLDELPQLFNVLRGEMSIVGPRPWALYDALRISGDGKRRLNSLPGVTGAWQVSARSTMLDLDAVTECDLSYLRNWSLWSDLKILLMTVPKVLSGFGAF
ncbi:MAG: UDP-phosphate galactose phosphotransferase [Pseudanabaena frigida]|uniref:UDP-phosphate galactose phosphotransferase n=1 Tax=Pseudanabaena frigida TaxID=945775 RepID=A0A2W4Y7E4_9CYAN|nr:MAG: UDP-phosphate galactose phosphotransferase [Pseudanabaena frigida]